MSISKIQMKRKKEEYITQLVQKGIEPNNFELNKLLTEYFDNHILGMPYYSPIKQIPYEESSKKDYNHNFETLNEDINTIYEANIEVNNKAVAIQEYYDTEKSKVFHAIDKIVLRTNTLQESLKSNKKIQEYIEVFDSLYNLEMYGDESRNIPYTTSFVDLLQKRIYTEKVNSQVNKMLINNGSVVLNGVNNFESYTEDGNIQNILNDTINDIYIFTGQSFVNTDKKVDIYVDLGKLMTFNTIILRSTSSNDVVFTASLSDDGDNYYTIYDIEGKDIIEWNFDKKTARYIKLTITKQEADGMTTINNTYIYEYYYILKNLTIANEQFEMKSVLVTKPIEFMNLTNFVKLDAKDMTFNNTRIDYFIGFDNGTGKIGWDSIENHKEHELFMFEKQHKIANFGTYENFAEKSSINGLYKIFELPDGTNVNSLKVIPGYNMWAVTEYNRTQGDSDDGFSLTSGDITNYIKQCFKNYEFMDCENYHDFQISTNVLYIFTQYIDAPSSSLVSDKYIHVINSEGESVTSDIKVFLNGYEQSIDDNGKYAFNIRKGVNKIQIAVYSPSSQILTRYLEHNINFKELTNDVYAYPQMKYTNNKTLGSLMDYTFEYYTIRNNTIYVNFDPENLISKENDDMGFMIIYYSLKPDMERYFSNNKLKFRIMAVLSSKDKNMSPSIINFKITGK